MTITLRLRDKTKQVLVKDPHIYHSLLMDCVTSIRSWIDLFPLNTKLANSIFNALHDLPTKTTCAHLSHSTLFSCEISWDALCLFN